MAQVLRNVTHIIEAYFDIHMFVQNLLILADFDPNIKILKYFDCLTHRLGLVNLCMKFKADISSKSWATKQTQHVCQILPLLS